MSKEREMTGQNNRRMVDVVVCMYFKVKKSNAHLISRLSYLYQ